MPRVLQILLVTGLMLTPACQQRQTGEGGATPDMMPADTATGTEPTDTAMTAAGGGEARGAHAAMQDAQGNSLGEIALSQTSDGVRLSGNLTGIPAGQHGIHIHQTGQCDAPKFEAAGEHFNPTGRKHGLENPAGPHAGDMPNLDAAAGGGTPVDFTNSNVTLEEGQNSLLDADGSAVVVHAQRDDQKTDPSGDSGDRIACGVVAGHGGM